MLSVGYDVICHLIELVLNAKLNSPILPQDSHMKIILGSTSNAENGGGSGRNSRKNGVVNSSNSGLVNATSAIRSGFTALKAGVLEAASGRRGQSSNDSPLINAASMAIPSALVKKKQEPVSRGKRETPL